METSENTLKPNPNVPIGDVIKVPQITEEDYTKFLEGIQKELEDFNDIDILYRFKLD